jgi:MFS family permease
MKQITRTVWILSLVSLFADTASEMLYPILPIYLQSIGFSVALIGVLEGIAEATTGLSKSYFGKLSDLSGRRVPFVQVGYALSAISKPMMATFTLPLWVFLARTTDRFGKGIRTGARDALLSDEATPQTKGAIFGFHRSMDTLGAVVGPSLALLFLYFYPEEYRMLFFIAFIPGLLAVAASLLLREKMPQTVKPQQAISLFAAFNYWKESQQAYKKLVGGLLVFTLFNSSDVFLLLQAKQVGMDDKTIIGIYIFYNFVYALFAFPAGLLADHWGLKNMFIIGLALFATVYFGIAVSTQWYVFFGLFFLYGIYAASTEGITKAWISNLVDKKDIATAIGTFTGLQSICALLASSLTGLIWFEFGAAAAFVTTATATLLLLGYFIKLSPPKHLLS